MHSIHPAHRANMLRTSEGSRLPLGELAAGWRQIAELRESGQCGLGTRQTFSVTKHALKHLPDRKHIRQTSDPKS